MKLGAMSVDPIRAGTFKLDGGAMFGVVPRVLWEKLISGDDRNRITLGLNCLLVRTPECKVLVETGIGDKLDAKRRFIYGIEEPFDFACELSRLGADAAGIDYVVCSHLHFDHAGGCTGRRDDGSIVPLFPNARYIVRKEEWADALDPDPRSRASYLREDLDPLAESGQLELIGQDCEIVPGIFLEATGGHTRGHQVVRISSEGETLCFIGDIMPTEHHLKPSYTSSYDTFPLDTMRSRADLLGRAVSQGWILALPHSVDRVLWRAVEAQGGIALEPA
jgi:glyoxylase-like metal-dependent hydrolase (beta-lactamase superfamily II)